MTITPARVPEEVIINLGLKKSKYQAGKAFMNGLNLYDFEHSDKNIEVTITECNTSGEPLSDDLLMLWVIKDLGNNRLLRTDKMLTADYLKQISYSKEVFDKYIISLLLTDKK